jgi:hypothetical protein
MMFLALAAAAGVLVGRLGRSAVAANTSLDSQDSDSTPARAYSGTDTLVGSDPTAAGYAGGVGAAGVNYEPGPAYVATGTDPAYAGTAGAGYTGTAAPGHAGAPDPGFAAPAPGYAETLDPSDPGYTESPQNPAQGYDQGIR